MANKQIKYNIGFNVDDSSLQKVKSELQQINQMTLKDLKVIDVNANKRDLDAVKESAKALGNALEASYNPKLGTLNVDKFNNSLNDSRLSVAQIEANFSKLGVAGQTAFRNMTAEILTTEREVKKTSNFIDQMANTLSNTIRWTIASNAINTVTGSVQKAWSYTKRLDESLNNIRIVTEKSADDMDRFAKQANKAAKSLGAATTQYTNAALIYYQQGLDEESVQTRTDITLKAANVTGQSAAEVSEQLTAVWNGYKVVAEEAELYVDKLAAVAASTAADLEELSDGMSKVASIANTMGVDIDQLSAQLATIVSVTREDASAVGNAMKTIFARMGDLQVDGVDEFGVTLGDVSSQMRQMGIDVLDQQGNLRDLGKVIEEVAGKWGTWTSAQQQAAAIAMAGKRQYNNLIALFENWDMYESALSTSQGSAGTLQKQQDIYMDSIEAHLNQLATAGERVYDAFFDNDSMKDLLDALTNIVDLFAGFVESIGGGGNLLLTFGSIATQIFSDKIAGGIANTLTNLNIMRQSIIQNRAELEIQEKYSSATDKAIKEMVAIKEKELKYNKLITEEQRAQFELFIKQTAAEHNKIEEEKNKIESAKSYYTERFGHVIDLDAQRSSDNRVTANKAAQDLDHEANSLEDEIRQRGDKSKINTIARREGQQRVLLQSYKEFQGLDNNQLIELQNQAEIDEDTDKVSAIQELINVTGELNQQEKRLNEDAQNLINTNRLSQKETNKLIDIRKQYSKGSITLAKYEEAIQEALKGTAKENRNVSKALKEGKKNINDAQEGANSLKKSYEDFSKNIDTTAAIQQIVKLTGSIGSLTSGIRILKNLGSIWDNESLSTGEKIAQTITSVTSGIGIMTNAFKEASAAASTLKNIRSGASAVEAVQKAITEAGTEAEQKRAAIEIILGNNTKYTKEELEKKSLADLTEMATSEAATASTLTFAGSMKVLATSIWQTLVPLLPYIAAAAALAGVIALIVVSCKEEESALEKATKAYKEAQEVAKNTKSRLSELKDEYDSVLDIMTDYKDAKLALDDLRVGTEEWQQAVQKLNYQVLELISNYPTLVGYLKQDRYGIYSIEQEGWTKLINQKQQEIATQQAVVAAANLGVSQAEGRVLEEQKKEEIGRGFGNIFSNRNSTTSGYDNTNNKVSLNTYKGVDQNLKVAQQYEDNEKLIEIFTKYLGGKVESTTQSAYSSYAQGDKNALYKNTLVFDENSFDRSKLSDLEIKDLNELINTLEDDELKQEINNLIDEIEDNNKAITNNNTKTEELTKAYYNSLADKNNTNRQVFTNITDAIKKDETANTDVKDGTELSLSEWRYKFRLRQDDNKSAFKNLVNEYGLEGFNASNLDDEHIWGAINTSNDRKSAKKYIEEVYKYATGKDITIDPNQLDNIKTAKIGDFTFTDSEGKEVKFDEIITQAAQKAMEQQLNRVSSTASGKTPTELLQDLQKKGIAEEAAYFLDGNAKYILRGANGEAPAITWQGANLVDIANLKQYENKVDNPDQYSKDIEAYMAQFESEANSILAGTGFSTGSSQFRNFTLDEYQLLVQNISNANAALGDTGKDAIVKLFDSINSPELAAKVNNLLKDTNFADTSSINEFRSQLLELGIDLESDNEIWKNFVNEVNSGSKQWISDQKKVIENLQTIQDIAKNLSAGDVIGLDDYKELVKLAPEISKLFIQTAEGMELIGSGDELNKSLKKQYENLKDIKTQYENIDKAAKNIKGAVSFTTDAFKAKSTEEINQYFGQNERAMAAALGISTDNIDTQLNALRTNSTDSTEYIAAQSILAEYAKQINQAALDAEQGLFTSKTAEEIWATSIADSWRDLYKEDENGKLTYAVSDSVAEKALDSWKNKYLSELGIELDKELVESLDIEKLEKQVQNVRKLELDYLFDIENEISKLDVAIDNAFGKAKVDELGKKIEVQIKAANIAIDQETIAKDVFNNYLNDFGLKDNLSKNGEFDLQTALNYQAKFKSNSTEYKNIQTIIDFYNTWQDKQLETIEAQEAILDLQIEQYETEIDLKKQLRESIKNWDKAAKDLTVGIGKISSSTTLSNLISSYNKFKNIDIVRAKNGEESNTLQSLVELQKFVANGKAAYVLENGNFNEAAYMEKYEKLLEDAQADIEELRDLAQDMLDTWIDSLNEISELYDEQAERLSTINSLLESSANLSTLLGRNAVSYYQKMRENAQATTVLYASQEAKLKAEYEKLVNNDGTLKASVSQDMADAAWEAYTQARENHLDALQEEYEAITVEFESRLQSIVDSLFANNGGSLSNFSELWNLEKSVDEMYFDSVNAEYEKSKFEREVQKSIDSTDSITAQNKLNKVLKEQLKILEEKDKLSQYDLDHANAMYELTLKQIALEEAQQTSNKMKLTRDAMGNYTYQYVADENKIAEAENDLAAAENKLYNLEKDHQSELIDSWISQWQEYQELLVKYAYDDEMLAQINEKYSAIFGNLNKDLEAAGAVFEKELPQSWQDALDTLGKIDSGNLGEQIQDLLSSNGTIGSALGQLFGENGSIATTLGNTMGAIENTLINYTSQGIDMIEDKVSDLSEAMGKAASAISAAAIDLNTFATSFSNSVNEYIEILTNKINPSIEDSEKGKSDEEIESAKETAQNTKIISETVIKIADFVQTIPIEKNPIDILPNPGNNFVMKVGGGSSFRTADNLKQ